MPALVGPAPPASAVTTAAVRVELRGIGPEGWRAGEDPVGALGPAQGSRGLHLAAGRMGPRPCPSGDREPAPGFPCASNTVWKTACD